jgi:hypothetical protein
MLINSKVLILAEYRTPKVDHFSSSRVQSFWDRSTRCFTIWWWRRLLLSMWYRLLGRLHFSCDWIFYFKVFRFFIRLYGVELVGTHFYSKVFYSWLIRGHDVVNPYLLSASRFFSHSTSGRAGLSVYFPRLAGYSAGLSVHIAFGLQLFFSRCSGSSSYMGSSWLYSPLL